MPAPALALAACDSLCRTDVRVGQVPVLESSHDDDDYDLEIEPSSEFRRLLDRLCAVHVNELSKLQRELLLARQRALNQRADEVVLPAPDQMNSPGSAAASAPLKVARNVTISSKLASMSEKGDEEAQPVFFLKREGREVTRQSKEELQLELEILEATEEGAALLKEENDQSRVGRLRHSLNSSEYELAMTLIIFINALVIGLQFQYEGFQIAYDLGFPGYPLPADELWPGSSTVFTITEVCFTTIFALDVLMRAVFFRYSFFCDWFNLLDTVVVISSILDQITSQMFNTSVLRLLRLTKLTRSIRILKVSSVLDSLAMIMKCLRASVGTLFWSLCVLLVIQCIGAITIMFVVQQFLRNPNNLTSEKRMEVFAYYGTFSHSMLTMFEVLFANWITPCRILVDNLSEWFSAVFILYRCLVGFAVLNVIQAVFIQRTMQVAQDDKELQLKQKQYAAEAFSRKLHYIFEELDTSGDGVVTWDEFKDQLKDPRTTALLSMIEIDTHDVRVFYDLLDDGRGKIDAKQFAQGVLAMKGPAKSVDLARLSKNVQRLGAMVHQLVKSNGEGVPVSNGLSDIYRRK